MITSIKKVNKPWGHELWLADGKITPYALKRILFKAGNRTSLQVHEKKFETNYVLNGTGILLLSKENFDIENFLENGMTEHQVLVYESNLEKIDLQQGHVFNISPRYVHRVIATTDLEFIECSTCDLDDVIRLHDDKGRSHGKIISEHE